MKFENKITLDFVMLLILMLLQFTMVTGKAIHEILGMAFVIIALVHCTVNLSAIKHIFRKSISWKTRARLSIDFTLIILLLTLVLSGAMISVFIFKPFNIAYHGIWYTVHLWSARTFLLTAILHLAINMRIVVAAFRKKQPINITRC